MNKNAWYVKAAVWVLGLMLMFSLFKQFAPSGAGHEQISYSQFLQQVHDKQIKTATIPDGVSGGDIMAERVDGRKIKTTSTYLDRGLVGDLIDNGVAFDVKERAEPSLLMSLLINWGPMLLLVAVWIYFMRQMQGGGKGGPFSFGKSKARMLDEGSNTVTFADVAGCDEAKEEVKEVVDFLKDPSKYQKLGGASRVVCSWSALLARVKRCWLNLLLARRKCLSSASRAQTLLRCLSASAHRACAICLITRKRTHRASSLLMRSTLSVANAALAWVVAMTNASKP